MGLPILLILVGLATLTIQKSVKLDIQDTPELEVLLQNLLNQGHYKDVKLKINPNKKIRAKDLAELQYLGEISSEKDGKEGLKSLNKKLAKLLDGLQENVMNENDSPKCTCGYASKLWPGVIKCQCLNDDEPNQAKDIKEIMHDEHVDENRPVEIREIGKRQERRKIKSVKGRENKHIARLNRDDDEEFWSDDRCSCSRLRSADDDDDGDLTLRCNCKSPRDIARISNDDRDEGYWSDDNWCGCKLLRSTDDGDDNKHTLRCRCNSPARIGTDNDMARISNDDRDEGYWSDDNWCGCKLLRSTDDADDNKHTLRCRCNQPARIGRDNDKEVDFWSDDDNCDCQLLRNRGNVKDLRCRCGSPSRAGRDVHFLPSKYKPSPDDYSAILTDLSEEDDVHGSKNSQTKSDDSSLNMLMGFVLDKDDDLDLSHLTKKDRKVLLKLKDLITSQKNININELKDDIETVLHNEQYPLREIVSKEREDKDNPLNNLAQIQKILQLIEAQKPHRQKKSLNRRSMTQSQDSVGVPFEYELHGLAQINT